MLHDMPTAFLSPRWIGAANEVARRSLPELFALKSAIYGRWMPPIKYWEIVADKLSAAVYFVGYCSAVTVDLQRDLCPLGRQILPVASVQRSVKRWPKWDLCRSYGRASASQLL